MYVCICSLVQKSMISFFCNQMVVNCSVHMYIILLFQQYTVISCLFREQSKLLTRGAGDDLRTVAWDLFLQQSKTVVLIVPSVLFCIYFFHIIKDWSKLFVRFIWNNLNQVVTPQKQNGIFLNLFQERTKTHISK